MVRPTENDAVYWARQADGWIDQNVHGKDVDDVVAIAGDAVVVVGDDWSTDDVRAMADGMADAGIPVYATRGTDQVRIDGTDDTRRLSVPYDTDD